MEVPTHICAALPLSAAPAVLIVDDDYLLLELLPTTLKRHVPNLSIETCQSSRLAAQKLAEGHYDAVITDLTMVELDGFGVLAQVTEVRPCMPVLFISGQSSVVIAERAFHVGAFDFITKPLDPQLVAGSVSLAIKTHRLRRRIEERRVYLTQVREVLNRQWQTPLSIKSPSIEESRSLMAPSFDQMEAEAKRSERLIERAERVLRRRLDQLRGDARQRLQLGLSSHEG